MAYLPKNIFYIENSILIFNQLINIRIKCYHIGPI